MCHCHTTIVYAKDLLKYLVFFSQNNPADDYVCAVWVKFIGSRTK